MDIFAHFSDAALTCDPRGDYVRKWIPELEKLPDQFIHSPWKCSPSTLKRCGVNIGENYPDRIIKNLDQARDASLSDVAEVRTKALNFIDPHSGRDVIKISTKVMKMNVKRDRVVVIPLITRREFMYRYFYHIAEIWQFSSHSDFFT